MDHSILLVFAHPDDESFGAAGTAAKYSRQGIPVDLVTATKGEAGVRLDLPDDADLASIRESETRKAADIIGIRNIYFLGYIDGRLNKANQNEVADKVLAIMKIVQPEVVITFGPDGITGHPDHIAIGKAATRAFEILLKEVKSPKKLYYQTIPQSSVLEGSGLATRPDEEVTTAIDISDDIDLKTTAVAAHWSQQDSRDFVEMLKDDPKAFSKEHFYLAYPRSSRKETDFFARERRAGKVVSKA